MNAVETRDELVPLAQRLNALLTLRLLAAAFVLGVPALVGRESWTLAAATACYVALVGAEALVSRRWSRRATWLVSASVLADGAYLTFAVARTGGYKSSLMFLVFLYVMSVTLLVSHRTGLKVAVWCALLIFLSTAAAEAGVLTFDLPHDDRSTGLAALAFLLFAVGAAISSAVNERALRHSRIQLSALVDLDMDLERALRRDDAATVLARHARDRLGFRRVAVLVRREADKWWARTVDRDGEGEWVECHSPSRRGDETLRARCPSLVRSLDDEQAADLLPAATNVVLAPICADDEDLGLLVAEWGGRVGARIPSLTVRTLYQAAQHAGLALRHRALLDEVERLATRDALTGLANRRLLEETLTRELGRVRRDGTPLSAMVVDIDHFKDINDEHGHLVGDDVLRQVGAVLQANVKAFDLVARFGGDEFVVLLSGCSTRDSGSVAERVRAAVQREVTAAPVTTSAGVATIPDHALEGERLLTAADAALYAAKDAGRDRTVVSDRWLDERAGGKLAG